MLTMADFGKELVQGSVQHVLQELEICLILFRRTCCTHPWPTNILMLAIASPASQEVLSD